MKHWGHVQSRNGHLLVRVIDWAGKCRPSMTMFAEPGEGWIFAEMRDYMHSRKEMWLLVLMQAPVSFRYCSYEWLLETSFIENQHLSLWRSGQKQWAIDLSYSSTKYKVINVVSFNENAALCRQSRVFMILFLKHVQFSHILSTMWTMFGRLQFVFH